MIVKPGVSFKTLLHVHESRSNEREEGEGKETPLLRVRVV